MQKLDDQKLISRLDPNGVLKSVDLLSDQLAQVWQEFKKVKIPSIYRQVNKVIVNGMGGSQLGSRIIQGVYFADLKVPLQIINSYELPGCLDSQTLYIVSSYSGNTEEPLMAIKQAQKRGAKVFAIGSGGKLGALIKQGKVNGYVFDAKNNPSTQPRLGLGYSLAAQLSLLTKLNLLKVSDRQIKENIDNLRRLAKMFNFANPVAKNPAKKLAQEVFGYALAVVASEHLAGNAHVFANQINENSKSFSTYYLLPELNHHLLEGLKVPKSNHSSLKFLFLESELYFSKNQLRYQITKEVVRRNQVAMTVFKAHGKTRLSQALEVLALGSYVTFYLAILNNVNPNLIPWVDFFKAQLKKVN
ncbi:MAG: SIS domain-containing protein [Patescibacteria group bacterium]|jgi:glucose/mannose-6-phosphate isomerase|nr:SIS domain-containing protein [Patescibacteria group bacterium]